jgi:hypothetical protein
VTPSKKTRSMGHILLSFRKVGVASQTATIEVMTPAHKLIQTNTSLFSLTTSVNSGNSNDVHWAASMVVQAM